MRQYGEGIQINYDTPHKDGTPAENGMIHSNRESLSSDSSIAKHMITHRRAESADIPHGVLVHAARGDRTDRCDDSGWGHRGCIRQAFAGLAVDPSHW